MTMLSVDTIRLDERCQPRASINPEVIRDYAEAMTEGADFPPLTVYHDGETYWLADGFHRIAAAEQAKRIHVPCTVHEGTLRDAILHAVGANATHGMRRANLDKRRAVETLLQDDEWSPWSNSEIAKKCGVSHTFVNQLRSSLETVSSDTPSDRTYTDRYGNERVMNTANIGTVRRVPVGVMSTGEPYYVESDDEGEGGWDDGGPPESEQVDPSDPMSFLPWEPLPSSSRSEKRSPEAIIADNPHLIDSAADDLLNRWGAAGACRVADAIYERAKNLRPIS